MVTHLAAFFLLVALTLTAMSRVRGACSREFDARVRRAVVSLLAAIAAEIVVGGLLAGPTGVPGVLLAQGAAIAAFAFAIWQLHVATTLLAAVDEPSTARGGAPQSHR